VANSKNVERTVTVASESRVVTVTAEDRTVLAFANGAA